MKFLISILFLTTVHFSQGQTGREQAFIIAVKNVVQAFSKQDSVLLSKYIHKETGVHLLHRIGVVDTYNHFRTVSFSDSGYPSILFGISKGIIFQPLKYGSLPRYDCGKEAWSKKGSYVDTTRVDHMLTKICLNRTKHGWKPVPYARILALRNIENSSRRVVIVDSTKKELVFYLSFINGRWWITIVDTVTSDCSV